MAARKTPKSRAKSSHGGRRPGSGRKTKAATKLRAELLAEADQQIVDHLPQLVANLIKLADGGYRRVEEKWEPEPFAGIDPLTGQRREEPELVLVERKVSVAEPDRAANQYLIDRILGKTKQAVEVSGKDGEPLQAVIYLPSNGRDPDAGNPPPAGPAGGVAR